MAVLLLVGFHGLAEGSPDSAPPDTVFVEMTNSLDFEPEHVTVSVGRTIVWTNPSAVVHTVTADPALARDSSNVALPPRAEPFDSGNIAPGARYARTFTVPGRYRYFCIPHERAGMVGTVEVVESGDDITTRGESAPSEASGPRFELGGHLPPRHDEVRNPEGPLWALVAWLGSFHPPFVHFPIGWLVGAALAELAVVFGWRRETSARAASFCLVLGTVTAVIASVLGWFFAGFRVDDGVWLLTTHRWAGTALAIGAVGVLLLQRRQRSEGALTRSRTTYRASLFALAVLVVVTGFLGGAMIYGLGQHGWPATS